MLTPIHLYILSLLKSSIVPTVPVPTIPSEATEEDIKTMAKIIRSNGILLTVYPTLSQATDDKSKQLQLLLQKQYYPSVKQALLQDKEGKQILQSLSEAGFDVIGLKGWELRLLYPSITCRNMSDLDILVHNFDYKQIEAVMEKLGYTGHGKSSWMHSNFTKNEITVEMHKRLTDDSDYIQRWEKSIWDRATRTNDTENIYRMSDEDYYIFHMLHLNKDFKNGSLGLRRIADTWLFVTAHPNMDKAYLKEFFDTTGLTLFEERICAMARSVFEGLEIDHNSEIMLNHALSVGIYGTSKSYKLGRIATMSDGSLKKGKFRSFMAAVFLPYGRMKAHFPKLQKYPFLLPFYWIVRILKQAKNYKENLRRLNYNELSKEDFDSMKELMSAGGIRV